MINYRIKKFLKTNSGIKKHNLIILKYLGKQNLIVTKAPNSYKKHLLLVCFHAKVSIKDKVWIKDGPRRLLHILCNKECALPAYQWMALILDQVYVLVQNTSDPEVKLPTLQYFFSHHWPIFLFWQDHLNFIGHFLTKI